MARDSNKKGKIRQIYETLPRLNCGLCGFGNCGQFARAVAEGRASPFGCRQNPWSGYRMSEAMGMNVPAYAFQPLFSGIVPSPKALREEIGSLSEKTKDILDRIEKLRG